MSRDRDNFLDSRHGPVISWRQASLNGKQIAQNNALLQVYLTNQSATFSSELDRVLLEHPTLRKYVYGGAEIDRSNPDDDQFLGLADTIFDEMDHATLLMDVKDPDGESIFPDEKGWRAWAIDVFSTSPGLRGCFCNHENECYQDNALFKDIYEKGVAKANERRAR